MKQIYICEKCNTQYDDYMAACNCESSHLSLQDVVMWDFRELSEKQTWKRGNKFPDSVYIPVDRWDYENGIELHTLVQYKLVKEMPAEECARLYKEKEERNKHEKEEQERRNEERKAREAATVTA